MAAAAISLSIQLASVIVPQVAAIYKAIASLRQQGVPEADISALLLELASGVRALDAKAVDLVAGIPLPGELPRVISP